MSNEMRPCCKMTAPGRYCICGTYLTPAPSAGLSEGKCKATPCDIIRAINEERSRTCSIIAESGCPEGIKSLIFDRIHGADHGE